MASPLLQLFLDYAKVPKEQHAHWHAEFERQKGAFGKVEVKHSGQTFQAVGCQPDGNRIWPISEYLARSKHKKTVAERIERLNPYGKPEGERVRGVHPKFSTRHTIWYGDLVPERDYIKRWGAKPEQIALKRGRHKFVTRTDFMRGPDGR